MNRGGWFIFCPIWIVSNALAHTIWATFNDCLVSLAIFVSAAKYRERINLRKKKRQSGRQRKLYRKAANANHGVTLSC